MDDCPILLMLLLRRGSRFACLISLGCLSNTLCATLDALAFLVLSRQRVGEHDRTSLDVTALLRLARNGDTGVVHLAQACRAINEVCSLAHPRFVLGLLVGGNVYRECR